MANITSDVNHLRKQYETGKSHGDGLIVHYHGKQIHDGDQLTKAETQVQPQIVIKIESDPQHSFFTLVFLL